jgi:hypothetical protein
MMKTKEEILSSWSGKKLEIFTNTKELDYIHPYITPKQSLYAMEEFGKQSYIEASNFTHKSLIETLAKEINAISIDCNSNELTIINKVFLILEKYGYKR